MIHGPEHVAFAQIVWPDASFEELRIDYDAAVLFLRESNGDRKTLAVEGHIGHRLIGFWDEAIIERAEISEDHPGIEECLASIRKRLGESLSETGNPARNSKTWFALTVRFIDGCVLEIFGARLVLEQSASVPPTSTSDSPQGSREP